jgi:DNA invertase Pin-like site-specific DNA recombinase
VKKSLRVIGYPRVSTEEQNSLPQQAARIRQYCDLYELALVEVIPDEGYSGKTLDRPGLSRALALLDAGEADGLVVAKLDRLTRSVRDMARLIESHFDERSGRHLMSVAESIDTRTAAGKLVLNVLVSVAQWERETIVERTVGALEYRRSVGRRTGNVPVGFELDPGGPTNEHGRPVGLLPVPGEFRVLSEIVRRRSQGGSLRRIAAALTSAGYPTKNGAPRWAPAVVARILARPELAPVVGLAGDDLEEALGRMARAAELGLSGREMADYIARGLGTNADGKEEGGPPCGDPQ